jgi:hypothetical protein
LLGNGSVNMFPPKQNNVTTPLPGHLIRGEQPVAGQRKHIPVETVFSVSL